MVVTTILKETLRAESNPVNRMYLNELILNWKKVQTILDNDQTENQIVRYISHLNIFQSMLLNPKYSLSDHKSKTGFPMNHKIFQPYFMHDLIEIILKPTGILDNPMFSLKEQSFNFNIRYNSESFLESIQKPSFCYETTEKVYSLCLQLDLNYRPSTKKVFSKDKVNMPIMVFYIVKMMNKYDLYNIHALQHQIKTSNPNAYFAVMCEEMTEDIVDKIDSIKPILYIFRKIINTESLKELSLDVVLSLQDSIMENTRYKKLSNLDFVHQGCSHPYVEELIENDINSEE